VADLLEVIRGIDNQFADVMLVGHNPGFAQLSEYLTGEQLDKLPTSGVVRIEFAIEEWSAVAQGQGKMVLFDSPKRQE
jgi:phosphohistidine phosphatase